MINYKFISDFSFRHAINLSKESEEISHEVEEQQQQSQEESPILHLIEPPLTTSSPKPNSPNSKSSNSTTKREIENKGENIRQGPLKMWTEH